MRKDTARKRAAYRRRRAEGLCARCPAPALAGRSMCGPHLGAQREAAAEDYAAMARAGLCVQCRRETAEPRRVRCWRCLVAHADRQREARAA